MSRRLGLHGCPNRAGINDSLLIYIYIFTRLVWPYPACALTVTKQKGSFVIRLWLSFLNESLQIKAFN